MVCLACPPCVQVYKDECMFCFASPQTPGGLYINLTTHQVSVGGAASFEGGC